MRRSLATCVALLMGCGGGPADPGTKPNPQASSDAKDPAPVKAPVDAKAPGDSKPPVDTKAPAEPKAPPAEPTPPSEPTPPATPDALQAATTALIDRLVPVTERIAVTEAAAKALQVRVIDNELWVTEGSRRAPLSRRASKVIGVTIERDASGEPLLRITFEDDVACVDQTASIELSARTLLARLENAAAMKPHGKRDFAASARGFARAAQLDPSLDVAWTNLACALAMQGDAAAATAALDPMLRRAPLYTYHKVLTDPELASLREQPAVTALRAPARGDAPAPIEGLAIAYSAHHSLVALRRKEESWGACNYVEDLRLYEAKTGKPVLTLPLVHWDETDPECAEDGSDSGVLPKQAKLVKARLATAERFLQDMGFSVTKGLEVVEPPRDPEAGPPTQAKLPGAGLELVIDETTVTVRKGTKVIVTQPQSEAEGISRAGYDPVARVAFVAWYHSVPEGCADDADGTGFLVIPIPAAAE